MKVAQDTCQKKISVVVTWRHQWRHQSTCRRHSRVPILDRGTGHEPPKSLSFRDI